MVAWFNTAAPKAEFRSLEFSVKSLSECDESEVDAATKKVMENMKVKGSQSRYALNASEFLRSASLALGELQSVGVHPNLRVSLVVHMYVIKDGRIEDLFAHKVSERNFLGTPLNCAPFLELVFDNSQVNTQKQFVMKAKRIVEKQIHFRAMALVRKTTGKKKLITLKNAVHSSLKGMTVLPKRSFAYACRAMIA